MQQHTAFGPLTISVHLPDNRDVTVSAFCAKCGARRSPPDVGERAPNCVYSLDDGAIMCWLNPCGHLDTVYSLIIEEMQQCERVGCVLRVSDTHDPYCSAECACDAAQRD